MSVLHPHPGTTALALRVHAADQTPPEMTVSVSLVGPQKGASDGWHLRYTLCGDIDQLSIPSPCAAGPADGLWRHTCLEAFVQEGDGPAYREFNLSPSGQWAAYRFGHERVRAHGDLPSSVGPSISIERSLNSLTLSAWVPHTLLPAHTGAIGLCAVLETRDGQLSHWALHHPRPDRPDFHHAGGWIHRLSLPAPSDPESPA